MKDSEKVTRIYKTRRIVLDYIDVMAIIDRKRTTAWRMMKQIREINFKPPKGKVTIKDLSKHTGMSIEEITEFVRRRDEPDAKPHIDI